MTLKNICVTLFTDALDRVLNLPHQEIYLQRRLRLASLQLRHNNIRKQPLASESLKIILAMASFAARSF